MTESLGRILVIDDELGIREGCRRTLEPEGYTVDAASTGHEGLRRVKEEPFDLVLLDVVMPDVRGIELLGPIHEQDPEIICIIVTGYATVELAVQAIKAGAYDFLSKPFSSDLLLLAVRQGLERRQLSREAKRLRALEHEAAELARAKKELERLDRFKTTFMLTVAHELRAPLTALQSFLNTIQEGYVPPDQQKAILERANERAQELLDMVDDLLRLAAVKGEEEIAKQETLSLADVLEKVFPLLKAQADRKGIACALEIRHRPLVNADRDQMTQVWTNLISNGIKYTPPGGQVTVTLEEQKGWAVGTVADTGIGIAPEDQTRIFEEFYRTPQAKQSEPHGTGLGLALVKRIVQRYGGMVEVTSELGTGSRFTFRLPVGAAT
jgi:two-component system sensor histidine kinase/response regulator